MISVRSLCSIALVLVASGAAGCKEDPPPPQPEPASSAAANANKGKASLRTPVSPMAKVDPQSMKEYRVDVCYFGTLSLKQARDAYLASLGKDEPSEKKIPSFGNDDQAEGRRREGPAPREGARATAPPRAEDAPGLPGTAAAPGGTSAPAAKGPTTPPGKRG